MTRTVVVTPPARLILASEAREHLRYLSDDQDTLIEAYIDAVTGHIDGPDGWLGRAIGQQTLELRTDRFCDRAMRLRYSPIISVTSVKYLDEDDVEQTLAASGNWSLIDDSVVLATDASWPSTSTQPQAVRVRYVAGWTTIPAAIKAAVLIMVADLFRNRESVTAGGAMAIPMPTTAEALLWPYRRW